MSNADVTDLRRELLDGLKPFADAAAALGVSPRTAHRYRHAGWLVTVRVGGKHYVDIAASAQRLRERASAP